MGGALYAAIPALLKTRLNVNEILTSLMLTYASVQLIYSLIRAPWKDPMGMGFPQTRLFSEAARLPTIIPGTIVHLGVDLGDVTTKANLADALSLALKRTGVRVINAGEAV